MIASIRYYSHRQPAGVLDADLVRRVFVTRAGASPFALAPVLSFQELDFARQATGDWHAEGYSLRSARVEIASYSRNVTAALATSGFLPMLGVTPHVGTLHHAETAAGEPVVISDRLWREAFGEASTALGAGILVDGVIHTVIGILPSGFSGIDRDPVDVWLSADVAARGPEAISGLHFLSGLTRLAGAADEMSVTRRMQEVFAKAGSPQPIASVVLRPLTFDRFGDDGEDLRRLLALALTLALAVLLIALCNCVLLMAGSLHEGLAAFRTRFALGASPAQLWISVAGPPTLLMLMASLGLLSMFPASLVVLRALGMEGAMRLIDPGTIVTVAVLACLSIALVNCGLVFTHRRFTDGVPDNVVRGPAGSRFRNALSLCYLTVTSALSVALVPVARAYVSAVRAHPGFDASSTMVVRVAVDPQQLAQHRATRIGAILLELSALPGVTHTAASTSLPFDIAVTMPLFIGQADSPPLPVHVYHVRGDFVGALGLPLVTGHPARVGREGSSSVIINEALGARLPKASDKLGACLALGTNPCFVIDAIVRNSNIVSLGEAPRPVLYTTMEEVPVTSTVFFLVRMRRVTSPAVHVASALIRHALPGAALQTTSLQDMLRRQRAPSMRLAYGSALLLAIACALAFFGLRAVILLHVQGKWHALGIHATLGASRTRMFIESTRNLIKVAALSVFSGGGLGLLLLRVLSARLTSLELTTWPVTLAAAAALPMALTLAAMQPAWRASRMEPARLLRARAR